MKSERGVSRDRDELGRLSFRLSWCALAFLTGTLILSTLVVPVLLVENVSAAAPVGDHPCRVCAEASDPVQYTSLVALDASGREASAVSGAGLTIGVPSDPVQYTFLVALNVVERETGAVSGAGLTIGVPSDPMQYMSLVALSAAEREASIAASVARYKGLADCYVTSNVLCSIR